MAFVAVRVKNDNFDPMKKIFVCRKVIYEIDKRMLCLFGSQELNSLRWSEVTEGCLWLRTYDREENCGGLGVGSGEKWVTQMLTAVNIYGHAHTLCWYD